MPSAGLAQVELEEAVLPGAMAGFQVRPKRVPRAFRLKAALSPTGIMPRVAGSLDYQAAKGRRRARLNLKGVDAGDYTLRVGGVDVGMVHAERGRAKLHFDSEGRKNALPLLFDPRGRHVEVAHEGDVILEGDFPAE